MEPLIRAIRKKCGRPIEEDNGSSNRDIKERTEAPDQERKKTLSGVRAANEDLVSQ